MNGRDVVQPRRARGSLDLVLAGGDLLERQVGHQAADRQRQAGEHLAVAHHGQAALLLDHGLDGAQHVAVVGADHADVVRIVRDRRGERAGRQAEASDQPDANVARPLVALEDGQLEEIARGIGHDLAPDHERRLDQVLGDDLARHDPDHPTARPVRGQPQRCQIEAAQSDAVQRQRIVEGRRGEERLSVAGDDSPPLSTRRAWGAARSSTMTRSAW